MTPAEDEAGADDHENAKAEEIPFGVHAPIIARRDPYHARASIFGTSARIARLR